ncbi:hypothetical protein WR25_04657 [Diploscapter pachys]|uniref:Phosphorylated adapter RNA export protein n=1 Tax=Diploscapter pachys TaxID=2018661 RepID=A0A2A2KHB9_9BILA|nr:hypothetical protein WR25_04657 [Diploscapter pachys]
MDFRSHRADCGSDSEPEATPLDEQEEEGLLPNSPVNANAGHSEEPIPKKRARNNIWADVLMEQQLEEAGSSINLDTDNANLQRIRRGPESYLVPKSAAGSSGTLALDRRSKGEKKTPDVIISPPAEELFGETPDLSHVETFGIPENKVVIDKHTIRSINSNLRGRGRGRGRGGRGGFQNSRDGSSEHNSRPNSQAHNHKDALGNRKRNSNGVFRQPMNALMSNEFSPEMMMSLEFAVDTPLEQLGEEMAQAMGEKETDTIRLIVQHIKQEKAIELFNDMREIETAGGMMILDGSRRRTPGGVFIFLFKSDPEIDTQIKDLVGEESRKKLRALAKANKKKNARPKTFAESLEQAESAMREAKNREMAARGQSEHQNQNKPKGSQKDEQFKISAGELQDDMQF